MLLLVIFSRRHLVVTQVLLIELDVAIYWSLPVPAANVSRVFCLVLSWVTLIIPSTSKGILKNLIVILKCLVLISFDLGEKGWFNLWDVFYARVCSSVIGVVCYDYVSCALVIQVPGPNYPQHWPSGVWGPVASAPEGKHSWWSVTAYIYIYTTHIVTHACMITHACMHDQIHTCTDIHDHTHMHDHIHADTHVFITRQTICCQDHAVSNTAYSCFRFHYSRSCSDRTQLAVSQQTVQQHFLHWVGGSVGDSSGKGTCWWSAKCMLFAWSCVCLSGSFLCRVLLRVCFSMKPESYKNRIHRWKYMKWSKQSSLSVTLIKAVRVVCFSRRDWGGGRGEADSRSIVFVTVMSHFLCCRLKRLPRRWSRKDAWLAMWIRLTQLCTLKVTTLLDLIKCRKVN